MFQKIKEFLLENKEKIFSLLGKAVLFLVLSYLLYVILGFLNEEVAKFDPILDFLLKIGGIFLLYKIFKNQNDFAVKQNKLLEAYLKYSEKTSKRKNINKK